MNQINKIIFIVTLFVMSVGCGQKHQKSTKISIETIKQKVIGKDVFLLDVRTPQEYHNGFIGNAVNVDILNKEKFISKLKDLDKDKPVYLYCRSGNRSNKASNVLAEMGFKYIYDYAEGWSEWSQQKDNK